MGCCTDFVVDSYLNIMRVRERYMLYQGYCMQDNQEGHKKLCVIHAIATSCWEGEEKNQTL